MVSHHAHCMCRTCTKCKVCMAAIVRENRRGTFCWPLKSKSHSSIFVVIPQSHTVLHNIILTSDCGVSMCLHCGFDCLYKRISQVDSTLSSWTQTWFDLGRWSILYCLNLRNTCLAVSGRELKSVLDYIFAVMCFFARPYITRREIMVFKHLYLLKTLWVVVLKDLWNWIYWERMQSLSVMTDLE